MLVSRQPGAVGAFGGLLALSTAAFLSLGLSVALAQEAPTQKPQPKPQAQTKQPQEKPAPGQKTGAAGEAQANENAWVKLCDKVPQAENKEICLTHHERLDGNSGMVLVAAAIRKVEGSETQHILVTIPTAIALAIPAGVQLKIDENEPMPMKYSFCYGTSCQAEAEATPELIENMKNGKQMVVAAMNMQRKAVGFPVPLTGFSKAYEGAPIDSEKYQEARKQLMLVIAKRQRELANKAAEAAKKKEAEGGDQSAPQAGAQAPAAAATPKTN